mmetsp:Transcript_42055/g.88287  ORF Transcript_42055/g.88287 Transcript_42055/m.88287 type:complete len:311 (+) Transcript_42055:2-934(+)
MWMEGKTGKTRRNVNYAFSICSIFHFWMISETTIKKIGQNSCFEVGTAPTSLPGNVTTKSTPNFGFLKKIFRTRSDSSMITENISEVLYQDSLCGTDTLSPTRIRVESVLSFFLLTFMLYAMKSIIAYVLNEFNDTGGLITNYNKKSSSRLRRAVNWFVKTSFSAMSNSYDSLFDREDAQKELGTSQSSQENRRDEAIQRSIEKSRKTLKNDLKGQFEQLQISLREIEEQNKDDVSRIEEQISALVESQQLLVQAIMPESEVNGEYEGNGECDEDGLQNSLIEGVSEGSESSLSLDEIDVQKIKSPVRRK